MRPTSTTVAGNSIPTALFGRVRLQPSTVDWRATTSAETRGRGQDGRQGLSGGATSWADAIVGNASLQFPLRISLHLSLLSAAIFESSPRLCSVFLEESGSERGVAEGFGASWTQSGECAGGVAERRGTQGIVAAQPGAEETRIEAVASADGIDGIDDERRNPIALEAARSLLLNQSAAWTALDDDEGDTRSEGVEGFFECGLAGYLLDFIFVRQEQVDLFEEGGKDPCPIAGRVIVGVERYGEPGLLKGIE